MDIKDGNANFAVRSIVKSVNKKYADGNGNIDIDSIVKKSLVSIFQKLICRVTAMSALPMAFKSAGDRAQALGAASQKLSLLLVSL